MTLGISKRPPPQTDEVLYFDFQERRATFPPVDRVASRTLFPFGGTNPAVITGVLGPARRFQGEAFFAQVGTAYSFTGDLTAETLLFLDTENPSPSEYMRVAMLRDAGPSLKVPWLWAISCAGGGNVQALTLATSNGTLNETTIDFSLSSGWHHWVMTRVLTPDGQRFRVFVDGMLRGETPMVLAPVDIAVDGVLSVGGEVADETLFDPLYGDMQYIRLYEREMCAEEVLRRWFELDRYPADALAASRAGEPVHVDGQPLWSWAPTAIVRRERDVEAEADSMVLGQVHGLDDGIPDRMYGSTLTRWEEVLRLRPRADDDTVARRQRGHVELARVRAFTPAEYQAQFAEILDTLPSGISVLEYSNRYRYTDFSSRPFPLHVVNGGGGAVAFTGSLIMFLPVVGDYRWPFNQVGVRQHVTAPAGSLKRALVVANVLAWPTTDGVFAGIVMADEHGRMVFAGNQPEGGDLRWVTAEYSSEGVWSAPEVRGSLSDPVSIGLEHLGLGQYRTWVGTGLDDRPGPIVFTSAVTEPVKVWLVMFTAELGVPASAPVGWQIDEALMHFPEGREAFHFQLHRPGADAGAPDQEGAEQSLQGQKPAHVSAHVTLDDRFRLGHPHSVLGRNPLR